MSKTSKPGKKTVELPSGASRPSRIRREPVRIEPRAEPKPRNRERELWLSGAGIVAMAFACVALVVGISNATGLYSAQAAPGAEAEPRFRHCYNAAGADCVRDGDTVFLNGQRVEIAADAPEIAGARCASERQRGIAAANRLRELLNKGEVTLGGTVREIDGLVLREVAVDGEDVGAAMIASGVARAYAGAGRSWC